MKQKGLIITTILFFIIVNTLYLWEGSLGLVAFPVLIALVIIFLSLLVILIRQLFLLIKEKWKNKRRLIISGCIFIVLALTFYKPNGLIDFDKLQGNNLLIASREGGGNCTTTLKLKENYQFRQRSVCFGVTEIKGTYKYHNDTIFFEEVKLGRYENEFFSFALIKPSKYSNDSTSMDIIRFQDQNDTIGRELYITKNELHKLIE